MARCPMCFRHCERAEGELGFCRARKVKGGVFVPENYGKCTSLALDPIEKKPLKLFCPGSKILSYGSYGCNLRCPFCQNYEISQQNLWEESREVTPEELVRLAKDLVPEGNIGIAFTYNEPMVDPEMIRDTFLRAKKEGLKTVVVTNGCASLTALSLVLGLTDAMNIDLKGFTEDCFRYLGGDLAETKAFIAEAVRKCHVELTTLLVPGRNDDEDAFRKEVDWIASLNPEIPLHLTRYFPRYRETAEATPKETLLRFEAIARGELRHVFLGNV